MTWVLIAAGLWVVVSLVFAVALCRAAADGDRLGEAAARYQHRLRLADELHVKRPRAADTAEGMTEGK